MLFLKSLALVNKAASCSTPWCRCPRGTHSIKTGAALCCSSMVVDRWAPVGTFPYLCAPSWAISQSIIPKICSASGSVSAYSLSASEMYTAASHP